MMTESLSALTQPTKGVIEPIQKLNQQAAATVEKLAAHQIASLKAYSDLGVGQLKAAAEVKDVEGVQDLMSKQMDFLKRLGECMRSDLKAMFEMGVEFVAEAQKVGAAPALEPPAKARPRPKAA